MKKVLKIFDFGAVSLEVVPGSFVSTNTTAQSLAQDFELKTTKFSPSGLVDQPSPRSM